MRIGIFGGTFDPPHIGHLIAAQEVADVLALDRLLFVPAALPPHKRDRPITPGEIRLRLVEAALEGERRFVVDDLELRRGGPSYTVDTLRTLHERYADAELYLIMGVDQFRELDSWRESAEVRRLAVTAVLERAGESAAMDGTAAGDGVRHVPITRVDVSSTQIRQRVAERRPVRYLVPPGVERLITELGLYTGDAGPTQRTGPPPGV